MEFAKQIDIIKFYRKDPEANKPKFDILVSFCGS